MPLDIYWKTLYNTVNSKIIGDKVENCVLNIVFGILLAVGSVVTAVGSAFMIMYGAKLLKKKSEIMF